MYSTKRNRRRGAVRKSTVAYLLPLALSVALVILVILIINLFVQYQSAKDTLVKSIPIASVHVETENVSLLLEKRKTSLEKGYKISLGNGEGLETGENARVFLPFMNKDYGRINSFSTIYTKYANTGNLLLGLQKGDLWLVTGSDRIEPNTEVKTKYLNFVMKSPAAVAVSTSLDKDLLYVTKGSLQVSIVDTNGTKISEILLKEGQKAEVDEDTLASLKKDSNISILQAVDTTTTDSDWYNYNLVEDTKMATYEGTENTNATDAATSSTSSLVRVLSPAAGAKVGGSSIMVSGTYEPSVTQVTVNDIVAVLNEEEGTWSVKQLPLRTEGNTTLRVAYKTAEGQNETFTHTIAKVSGTLPQPELTSPTTSEVSASTVKMEGSVDESIVRVVVNDYELKKFVAGSGKWLYYLSAVDGNMKEGKNTYTVIGYDEVGNASSPLEVEITYAPKEEPVKSTTTTPTATTPKKNTNTNTAKTPTTSTGVNTGSGSTVR